MLLLSGDTKNRHLLLQKKQLKIEITVNLRIERNGFYIIIYTTNKIINHSTSSENKHKKQRNLEKFITKLRGETQTAAPRTTLVVCYFACSKIEISSHITPT
jgi:hypothetical protein